MSMVLITNILFYFAMLFQNHPEIYNEYKIVLIFSTLILGFVNFILDFTVVILFRTTILKFHHLLDIEHSTINKFFVYLLMVLIIMKSMLWNLGYPIFFGVQHFVGSSDLIFNIYNWNLFYAIYIFEKVLANAIPVFLGTLLL